MASLSDQKLKEAIEEVTAFLEKEKPHLFEIERYIQESMPNGVANITVRVHQGKVTDVLIHNTKRIVFKSKADTGG